MEDLSSGSDPVAASAGSGPHVLRWLNAAAVLTALRGAGRARVADLMARTSLTRPTVTQALAALEQAGWAQIGPDQAADQAAGGASGRAAPRLGRPAQQVRFRAEAGYLLGVDVGAPRILVIVTDLAGTVLTEYRKDIGDLSDGPDLVSQVAEAMDGACRDAGLARSAVMAVSVGTPGIVVGAEVLLSPSIPGWAGISLDRELARRFDCPVLINNDVNLAVLAEGWQRRENPVETLVFVHWGARLGAGLIIGGRLHRGGAAAAGEIGFLDLGEEPADRNRADGLGPLEAVAGTGAIVALAREAVRRTDSPLRAILDRSTNPLDATPVFAGAAAGDPVALAVVDRIAARFARGLSPVFLLLDPDLVVIGGGVAQGGQVVLDAVERHLRARTLVPPKLVLSSLGDTSVAVGAARLALDDVEQRLFSPAGLSMRQ
jgi:predicted NBD/HSP70 family sugar kinase